MNRTVAALWITIIASPAAAASVSPAGDDAASSQIEIRLETSANLESGPTKPCAVQATSRSGVAFWSALGEVGPGKAEVGFQLFTAANRCGSGEITGTSIPLGSDGGSAPFLIYEASATPKWDPGPMDPGPVPVVQIVFSLSSRQLTGFSPEGRPLYGEPAKDYRSVRIGEGEEFILPIPVQIDRQRNLPGIREVLIRIRAGQAGRPGATEYGAIAINDAAPGSEIIVDGGRAGRTGADGSGLLRNIPAGQRVVRLRNASGKEFLRIVTAVKGRTVAVSPEAVDGVSRLQIPFTLLGKNSGGFPEFRRVRDGAAMVQIPEGEFVMGNLETEGKPQPHPVYVSSFLMDKLPVTWRLYRRFAEATGRALPPEPYWGIHDDHPVSFVRWDEGRAYCEWAGARLPTEAEREKGARGTDGRNFPWGNEEPSPERGVFRRNWGYEGTDAVGIRPAGASPYGLLDTGGNVWEWCQDWYDPDYYRTSPRENPMGPKSGRARVVRGGSWDSRPTVLSPSCRNFGYVGYREGDFGFRCAADPPR